MEINNINSKVNFTIKKLLFLNVLGELPEIQGFVEFDESNLNALRIDLSIPVAKINTNNAQRDKHLLLKDFFNAAKYPNITFKSIEVQNKGGMYWAKGILFVAGTSNVIEIPFLFKDNTAIGNFSLNRTNYNVGKIPAFVASNHVDIHFECHLK
jgi:polyisoprenoid-binding protein YceI